MTQPIVAALAANMETCFWAYVVIYVLAFMTAISGSVAILGVMILLEKEARIAGLYMVSVGAFVSSWGYMALKLITA